MLVLVLTNYEEVSVRAARIVAYAVRKKADLRLGLASGKTPLGMYRELINLNRQENLNFSNVVTFNLDEYLGLNPDHPMSFHTYMYQNFFDHINIERKNIHIPDGSITHHFDDYCWSYENAIRDSGGIDLQVLGIGKTGHIGFNEPTSSLASRTRVKTLADETLKQLQETFGPNEKIPVCAITMGIGTILEARRILLLAAGAAKAEAVRKAVEGPISSSITASALQLHQDVTVILDEDAASQLAYKDYYSRVFKTTAELTPERLGK